MFKYNRFWHFWLQLNKRDYFIAFFVPVIISLLLIPAAVFFLPLLGLVVALPLIVGGAIALFTQLLNFFYNRQNQQLIQFDPETLGDLDTEIASIHSNSTCETASEIRTICSVERGAFDDVGLSMPNSVLVVSGPEAQNFIMPLLIISAALFCTPLWRLVAALPLFASGTIALYTQRSSFFFDIQYQRLTQHDAEITDISAPESCDLNTSM